MTVQKSGWKAALLGVFLLLLATGAVLTVTARSKEKKSSPQASFPQQSEYAGGEACFACHDLEEAFKKNSHYQTWGDEKLAWSERGCETCHGPGQAHIDGGGDTSLIFNFKKVAPAKASEVCLDCHLKMEDNSNFLRNEHGVNSVACTDCHSVHTPHVQTALLKARTPALCYDCHGEVRAQFRKPFRHKVNEGLMSCTDCHNQHGGFNVRQMRESAGNDMACFKCHGDKQGPFVYEHAPVKVEGCTLCHDPHSSSNPRMLKRSDLTFLCLECHATTPGVFGPTTPSFHNMSQARYRNCTTCHVNIHGSNISPVFFE